ncbi:unnamed protein product [Strongylus vulgaris]|uniref:Uncharacterized protein n=1 Tax=Strongylus vulgaris TaxID=40348 RepID=A0A3P7JQA6_STRVU|nr:unnamed protein product [Strongylus vulgaris]
MCSITIESHCRCSKFKLSERTRFTPGKDKYRRPKS